MIEKKWNLEEMEIRISNLKKIVGESVVDVYLSHYSSVTDNHLDVLYLTFYSLKRHFLKYDVKRFGVVNYVDFEPKRTAIIDYFDNDNIFYYCGSYGTYSVNNNGTFNYTTTSSNYFL